MQAKPAARALICVMQLGGADRAAPDALLMRHDVTHADGAGTLLLSFLVRALRRQTKAVTSLGIVSRGRLLAALRLGAEGTEGLSTTALIGPAPRCGGKRAAARETTATEASVGSQCPSCHRTKLSAAVKLDRA